MGGVGDKVDPQQNHRPPLAHNNYSHIFLRDRPPSCTCLSKVKHRPGTLLPATSIGIAGQIVSLTIQKIKNVILVLKGATTQGVHSPSTCSPLR